MLSYLHRLPDLGILAVVLSLTIVISLMTPRLGRIVFRAETTPERDEVAFDAFKAIMAMAGVVLAFSLAQADANLRAIETTVGREGSALSAVDRILLRMDKPAFVQARSLVAAYGETLLRDEWPMLSRDERSERADLAYDALSKTVRAITPDNPRQQAMYNELLKNLDDLAEYREEILEDADQSLPSFFWITIGGLMLIGFGLALLTEDTLVRRGGIAATAGAVSLLLTFVIIVDVPFEGQTSVSSHSIERALAVNARRH